MASNLPNAAELELILQFQTNPLLMAKSQQLRRCLLRNVLCEVASPLLQIPPPPPRPLNLQPLINFDPILEAIYNSPTTTFWEKTSIALDVFEFILVDPVVYSATSRWERVTGKRPFTIGIVAQYDKDLKAHFFPQPGVINREENDPDGRRKIMSSLVVIVNLRMVTTMRQRHDVLGIVHDILDVFDTLLECLEVTNAKVD